MSKSILYSHWSNSVQKTARKNIKYSRNETRLKIGHLCMAYSLCKILNLGENFKLPKICQNQLCIRL